MVIASTSNSSTALPFPLDPTNSAAAPLPPNGNGDGNGDRSRRQIRNKVIAACSGAVMTSLTMTPFDVVKTRLQSQPPPEPLFVPSKRLPPPIPIPRHSSSSTSSSVASTSTSTSTSATCCQKTYFTANASESNLLCKFDPRTTTSLLPSSGTHSPHSHPHSHAGHIDLARRAMSISSVLPLRGGATAQVIASPSCIFPDPSSARALLPSLPSLSSSSHPHPQPNSRHMTGLLDALIKIVRYEGTSSLWRGVGPALMISVPSQAGYMLGYDWLRRASLASLPVDSRGRRNQTGEMVVPLAAGAFSRTVIVTIFSPVELLRTRLQSMPAVVVNGQGTKTKGTMSMIRSLGRTVQREGMLSLWRGLPATLWRDVPFSAIYWAAYEVVKKSFTGGVGMGEVEMRRSALGEKEGEAARRTFGIAFVSGATSGMIAALLTNPFDVIKTRRQASASISDKAATSTLAILRDIARTEGWAGLMKGLSPRMAKVAPACGIMIGMYEGVEMILGDTKR